ncbi:MAG: M24 family metallopeptidase [Alphaproteobacteria bacterium]|nr:M24 family metallopeptidase [Alphaproteobacteria bacterium]
MEPLKTVRNGERVTPTFSEPEMARRQDALRQTMATRDLAAVLFTSIQNINYFSDFLYCGFGRPYGLVVTQDEATTISASIDGGQPWRRSFGDNLVYTDWQRDNFLLAVQRLLPPHGRVGVEFDHLTLELAGKLRGALPDVDFVDVGEAVMHQRMIKSAEEIALIKAGARIADGGGAACRDAIAEGVSEHEIASAGRNAIVDQIAETFPHAELMDSWVWFQSGINTDGAHNPVTARRLVKGDILSLNCFPMIAGYYTALERTLFLDHASDRALEIWEANCRVHWRGVELIRPGARCCDIAEELNALYREHDLLAYRSFGYGHSFGVLCHYYGREAALELREDIETVLEPGMVVSMEPMVMIPEGETGAGGYREHDILLVTEDGNENITGFPIGPEHNIVKA